MTEFASLHLAAVLLAFIPFLITLSLFLYVFIHFTHNKLTRPFFLFLIPFALWQLNEVFTRLSSSPEEVQYWCHLFNPFLNFIPPLGLHFAFVFARVYKWQKPLLLGLVLYLPATVFFFLSYMGFMRFTVFPSPFWKWLVTYPTDALPLVNAIWMFISMALMLSILLWQAYFKKQVHYLVKKQSKIIAIGLLFPVLIAFVTEFLFPFVFSVKPIPFLVSAFVTFPVCIFIALNKYELFLYSPKYVWEDIVKKMNGGIVIIDVQGMIHYTNQYFLTLVGYKHFELINTSIFNLIPDYENKSIFIQQIELRKKQISGKYTLVCQTKNKETVHFRVSGSPYYDKKGRVIGSVGIVEDISPVIQLEKSLQQKVEELNIYIYRTYHDLRSPLTSIMGLCMLAQNFIKDKNALSYFQMIESGATKLDSVLQDLQGIYRISQSRLNPSAFNLHQELEIIKQNLGHLCNYPKIHFIQEIELHEELRSDKTLITAVLENLLVNAVNYADLEKNRPEITIKAKRLGESIEISISDNGLGIETQHQQRVWELFFRANDRVKGNGLGLYIVKAGVERLNGKISFKSEVRVGTSFRITIPNA